MSRKQYARKAEKFVATRTEEDATDRMVSTCKWLLRTRSHGVEFGNDAIALINGGMTRGDADGIIKHLSKCPTLKTASKRTSKAEVIETTDAVIARMAREGKLGKVAQRKALSVEMPNFDV